MILFVDPNMTDTIDRLKATWPQQPATWETAALTIVSELAFQSGWVLEQMRPHDIEDYYGIGRWDILARACLADITWYNEDTGRSFGPEQVSAVLAKKQSDYGPRNIMRFGNQGLAVRLWDKIARLNNLQAKGESPENESVVDTKLDIVGYTVIAIMLELGWFELPLQKELVH